MSPRTFLRLTRCSVRRTAVLPSSNFNEYSSKHVLGTGNVHLRGVKTKTTIKASSLPQGALAPIEQDVGEFVFEEKTYPKVLQQHLNNTRRFKDCIVLTEVGDFYEMYFDQVDEYAPLVGLKKAKRKTAMGDVAMAGFQKAQLERYLKMFVQDLGKQVAISTQVKLPTSEDDIRAGGARFDRKVTRVITAGTLIDESFMDPFENNFLLSVHFVGVLPTTLDLGQDRLVVERYKRSLKVGLSWLDLSSGDFFTQSSDLASLPSLIARISPREIVLNQSHQSTDHMSLKRLMSDADLTIHFHEPLGSANGPANWATMLERSIPEDKQSEFTAAEIAAGDLVLDYVKEKLQHTELRLQAPVRHVDDESMAIDRQSLRNLELRSTMRDGSFNGSLLHAMRQTSTRSGARLLSKRLVAPSMSLSVINNRLDMVQEMLVHDDLRELLTSLLTRSAPDGYRLLQKFSVGRGDADDLLSLADTIGVMQQVADTLHEHILAHQDRAVLTEDDNDSNLDMIFLWELLGRLDLESPHKIAKTIQSAIDEEGLNRQHLAQQATEEEAEQMAEEVEAADASDLKIPKLSRRASRSQTAVSDAKPEDIWIMRRDASVTLKSAHRDLDKLLFMKDQLTDRLKSSLQAPRLMLKWSAKLGHFCHIKGRYAKGVLQDLIGTRVIASTNSTTSLYLAEWTDLGVRIDDAKLRIRTEEDVVFDKLRGAVLENLMRLRRNIAVLDELDVACSSAVVAKQRNLVRPILTASTTHNIIGGRHPTVDVSLKEQGRAFTSNDLKMSESERLLLITGPNMAGKSTYLRQNALITILAQTGCFVSADYAELGLVDKIFSRVGSADNLYHDQSTFMVEMLETADILKQATSRSFVIMDEVGRGTTPEDGVAVGYACLHHLHNVNKCRSLFATHFHALADMTHNFDELACYCTDVTEREDGSWRYDHKLRRGVNRASHALKVAKLAGMPDEALDVAADVLADLQRRESDIRPSIEESVCQPPVSQRAAAHG